MIISVPHTGTRSLAEHLPQRRKFWHFGEMEPKFLIERQHVDFPIRDPLATTVSWRCKHLNRTQYDEFYYWDRAIAFLPSVPHTVHVMENFPVTNGESDPEIVWKVAYKNRDLDTLKELPEYPVFMHWYSQPHVKSFFAQYYPDGFWWENQDEESR
jgi:hypothetical protein